MISRIVRSTSTTSLSNSSLSSSSESLHATKPVNFNSTQFTLCQTDDDNSLLLDRQPHDHNEHKDTPQVKTVNIEARFQLNERGSKHNLYSFLNRLSHLTKRPQAKQKPGVTSQNIVSSKRTSRHRELGNSFDKMVRESPKDSKNLNSRATSLIHAKPPPLPPPPSFIGQLNAHEGHQESQRFYRSLSPKQQLDSFAVGLGQQPHAINSSKSFSIKSIVKSNQSEAGTLSKINKNVYFAQAIGQARVMNSSTVNKPRPALSIETNQLRRTSAERILEIHSSPVKKIETS